MRNEDQNRSFSQRNYSWNAFEKFERGSRESWEVRESWVLEFLTSLCSGDLCGRLCGRLSVHRSVRIRQMHIVRHTHLNSLRFVYEEAPFETRLEFVWDHYSTGLIPLTTCQTLSKRLQWRSVILRPTCYQHVTRKALASKLWWFSGNSDEDSDDPDDQVRNSKFGDSHFNKESPLENL